MSSRQQDICETHTSPKTYPNQQDETGDEGRGTGGGHGGGVASLFLVLKCTSTATEASIPMLEAVLMHSYTVAEKLFSYA